MSTTQTINAVLDAVETTLKADATLIALLGDSTNSILQRNHDNKLVEHLQKTIVKTPALIINYVGGKWRTSGYTHERTMSFNVDVVVRDPAGIDARENTAYPIMDAIFNVLLANATNELGLTNPAPDQVRPEGDGYLYDVFDDKGDSLGISVFRTSFEITVHWTDV